MPGRDAAHEVDDFPDRHLALARAMYREMGMTHWRGTLDPGG
jgi:hypothetical protein